MFFINDETTANRVVSLAVENIIARQRGNAHPVLVQRQVISMEIHALINREFDFMLPIRQQQPPVGVHILDKARDGVDVDGIRQISRQTHDNRDISVVAFTRQRQGAIHIHHDAGDIRQNIAGNQVIRELFAGFHWSNGM